MFWKFDLNTTSHVDKLLDKEHVTLQELMDEDDILQECKAQNQKLLDFLCRQQCMEELVSLITQDPPLDMEEKVRFKYPNTACELLTCDVPQISDRLGGDESLLSLLYDFLDHEPPLNPLLASFFSKTIGNLIARKTEQVITFLKKKDKFISLVLKHIGTSALMDLLLRLVSCVEPAGLRQDVLHWLNEEKVIQRLVELIHPSQDEDRQSNASQTLCDIVRLGRDQGSQLQEALEPDPLLTALESRQDCVEQLLKNMFDGDRTESCLVSGTQVLLTLLETRRVGTEGLVDSFSQGLERSYAVSSSVLHGIEPRLKDFHQLLLNPPKKKAILTTIGVLEEPLGNARLHGARLMAALLHTNTPSINQELCRLNTMDLLLDLFFKYTWNNFLHFQVELCIAAILSHAAREERTEASGSESRVEPPHENGNRSLETPQPAASLPDNTMVTHLFQKCCLVQRILEAWEANDHTQAAGGMRRGNMGHLTRIANAVVQNLERGPVQTHISEVIRGLPADCRGRWESFVEETLTETNRRNTVDLVSTHHLHSSSEDEDIEGAFPNELSLQQAFSDYQIQQMTANFVDQFGFNDEEFADQDDNINAPFDRIAEINFNIDADEDSPSAALFEACCSDRIQPFDDDEDEDIWEDSGTRCAARVTARPRFGGPHASESCSKNGPERGGQDGKASLEAHRDAPGAGAPPAPGKKEAPPVEGDSEAGAMWTAVFDEPANSTPTAPGVVRDVGSSVWAAGTSAPEEKGWAKFTDFQPFCCSESGPRCSSPVDTERSHAEGSRSQGPEKASQASYFAVSPASPCAWNVCVTRKAPLLASDSSSSGGSHSEDGDQKAASAMDAVSRGPGREAPPLPTVARTEEAVGRVGCADSRLLSPACPAPKEVTAAPAVAVPPEATVAITTALSKAGPAIPTPAVSSALAVAVPLGPIMAVTAAPAMVATLGTVTKDGKTDAPPEGAALNGPV
ncbi:serine/threonine-protein phosphatase 6 regulatory subunit 2 isoform X2 [Pan troglodytes]|uniref:serine/threonine-protein phosphatase 6 regulatory subunit 2 isoform X2 n=1 Tax=Pan troglodytes TaxID=9598 RepID=UPI0023F2B4FF|nr:serine/threonine-protein phosphatase 6 regulatory subunit 2 isoform X9 [Pan troglodytes]XP_016794266.2 serine/threonine-protein phosphatase 6 regulatory subunit 2 isoform X9 [Pan troglodytes]XP_016794267.2 serine/threonine-protein phosphatase 6 regulatory subunit 2 isoform X9 [Pan troglodytes]XP_016794270.2 serine/threonine-protein phosphatase 6 regulatory subunit 2 isoform X9 [Pan troglodytes]XP_054531344.1 serine/threonine-protein phosphatase 6 regulatory subunit 2 isoform X9 [Pan troglody